MLSVLENQSVQKTSFDVDFPFRTYRHQGLDLSMDGEDVVPERMEEYVRRVADISEV